MGLSNALCNRVSTGPPRTPEDTRHQGRREDNGARYTYIRDPDGNVIELVYHPFGLEDTSGGFSQIGMEALLRHAELGQIALADSSAHRVFRVHHVPEPYPTTLREHHRSISLVEAIVIDHPANKLAIGSDPQFQTTADNLFPIPRIRCTVQVGLPYSDDALG